MPIPNLTLDQPAREWLANVLDIIASKEGAGDDPTLELEVYGVVFEFRLKPETLIHFQSMKGHHETQKTNQQ